MDDRNGYIGKGRGFLLLNEIRNEKDTKCGRGLLSHPDQTPFEEYYSSDLQNSYDSNISIGRGHNQVINLIKSISSNQSKSKEPSSTIGHGRGYLLDLVKKHVQPTSPTSTQTKIPYQKYESSGVLGKLSDLSIYDPSASDIVALKNMPICRQGESGTKIDIFANYVDLILEPGRGLFHYEVKYSPDIESTGLRRKLLNQHSAKLGRTKAFDGTILYLPTRLPQDTTHYHSEHPMNELQVTLTIIYKKQQSMGEDSKNTVLFFNLLFGRIMRALSLVRIGRQNFNPKCAHIINQHRLEVWPGYVTAVNEYEGGIKLCLDAKHRVMRTQTVRDVMTDLCQERRSNYKDMVVNEIVGTSVLTRYNNKTYRIDDIAWDKTPQFVFSRDGENISLIDYYKSHWNIEIKDKEQPLLIHRATSRTPTGQKQEKMILLVPELSYVAGLTDNIRSNFKIMKDIDEVTRISPSGRRDIIRRFIEEIKKNEVTKEILSGWGLRISDDIINFNSRCLDPEILYFGQNTTHQATEKAGNWNFAAVNNPVLRTPNLTDWRIVYFKKDMNSVEAFLRMLQNIAKTIGMHIAQPRISILKDDKTETYLREIQSSIVNTTELIIIVFPNNRMDRYSAVKRLCCVQKPIPSQVIISKTISNASKLKSVTEKIALQINCKLGGALWAVNLPLKNCMVCGIDVYHSGVGGIVKRSVAGFIASLDTQLTKWHSKICMQASNQELVDMLQVCLTSAITAYHKHNGCNPDRIIIYRDGVGDGDLDYVSKYEVKQLLQTFNRIEPNYKPQLSVIIVQKRINTRLFVQGARTLENPPAGTIVDSCITRRNLYDFFLVPQSVRQGTVTPTHYIVIHDSSNLKTDHMQRLTYKLCHLYYNWSGTIRVPAPCQYAHKLVYLVGQNIQTEPHHSLLNTLFYL